MIHRCNRLHPHHLGALILSFGLAGSVFAQDPGRAEKAPASSVTLGRKPLGAGDTLIRKLKCEVSCHAVVSVNKVVLAEQKQVALEEDGSEITIVGWADGKPQKIRVTVASSISKTQVNDDAATLTPNSILGRSFELEQGPDDVEVTPLDGKEMSEEQKDRAYNDYGAFLIGEPMYDFASILPDRALRFGEVIKAEGEKARNLIIFDEDYSKTVMTLTPDRIEELGGRKVFVLKLRSVMSGVNEKGDTIGLSVDGELKLELETGRLVSLNVKGPLTLSNSEIDPEAPDDPPMDTRGTGEFSSVIEASYRRSK